MGPWTIWWRQNFFATFGWVDALMRAPWFHAAVMSVGAVTTLAGVLDVYALVTRRSGHSRRRPMP